MEGIANAISNIADFLNDAFNWLYEAIMYAVGYVLGYISQMQLKFFVYCIDFYDSIMNDLFQATEKLYDLIHIGDLISLFNSFMVSDACYMAKSFLMPEFFIAVISAYLIRFGIRRLPFIG